MDNLLLENQLGYMRGNSNNKKVIFLVFFTQKILIDLIEY